MVAEQQGQPEVLAASDPAAVSEQPGAQWLLRAADLRKKYCRDLRRSLWYSLSDVLGAFGSARERTPVLREHEFWAVDGISFKLNRGDSLGLLGRNGAGKSTLLKLLTGQRSLTEGRVETRGRVVALTELGLGFDPVLTGRENAYVNAAVHGVSRRAFGLLIEKIIDFSELREFIDSAVHTYSSGMKARLGFSVATHLSPDILIVDEVLAVGDLDFRRKCVLHVLSYLRAGGSVVLVAHDPYLIQSICNRAIVMERGRVVFDGSAVDGVALHFRMSHANQYADSVGDESSRAVAHHAPDQAELENASESEGAPLGPIVQSAAPAAYQPLRLELTTSRPVVVDRFSVTSLDGGILRTGQAATISLHYRSRIETAATWGFSISTRDLQVNIASCALGLDGESCPLKQGDHTFSCRVPELTLQAGVYAIRGGIGESGHNSALALLGYEEPPHFFTVAPPNANRATNWQVMEKDLVTMKVEWLS